MSASRISDPNRHSGEPRAFVLRIRPEAGRGALLVVTLDDVLFQRQSHFTDLEQAFAAIRTALNPPGPAPGQPQ